MFEMTGKQEELMDLMNKERDVNRKTEKRLK
jgi:hypothetical protein